MTGQSVVALWCGGCIGEVSLVVDVVARVRGHGWWWAEGSSFGGRVGVDVVGAEGGSWASENGAGETDTCQFAEGPGDGCFGCFNVTGEFERGDRVDAHDEVAEEGGDVEVWCS